MAIIKKKIFPDAPLSEESKIRLNALRDRPIFIDDDCPAFNLDDGEIIEMKFPRPKRPSWDNKKPIVINLNLPT